MTYLLNSPGDGRLRPKHVEWPCRNKTCTVLHQVVVFTWRTHKILVHKFTKHNKISPMLNNTIRSLTVRARHSNVTLIFNQKMHYMNDSWMKIDQLDVTCFYYFTIYCSTVFRMLVHPSSGACDLLWIYFMCCIALVRCVLKLRCCLAGVLWNPYAGWSTTITDQ